MRPAMPLARPCHHLPMGGRAADDDGADRRGTRERGRPQTGRSPRISGGAATGWCRFRWLYDEAGSRHSGSAQLRARSQRNVAATPRSRHARGPQNPSEMSARLATRHGGGWPGSANWGWRCWRVCWWGVIW